MYCIFQGGGKASTSLHVARTVCRRAERCVVPLVRNGELDKEAQVYLNRLVLWFFEYLMIHCQFWGSQSIEWNDYQWWYKKVEKRSGCGL